LDILDQIINRLTTTENKFVSMETNISLIKQQLDVHNERIEGTDCQHSILEEPECNVVVGELAV